MFIRDRTMLDAVFSPLLQSYAVPPLAVIVVVAPEHTLFAPVIFAVNADTAKTDKVSLQSAEL